MCASFVVLRQGWCWLEWLRRLHGNKSGTLNDGMFAQIDKKCSSILGWWSVYWKQHDVSRRQEGLARLDRIISGHGCDQEEAGVWRLWKKGWRLWTSRSEWMGATESYRAGVTWARWCFGGRIASPFSFSLAVRLLAHAGGLAVFPVLVEFTYKKRRFFHSVSSHLLGNIPRSLGLFFQSAECNLL